MIAGPEVWQAAMALLAVLGLAILVGGLARLGLQRGSAAHGPRRLRIIESCQLDQRSRIVILRCGTAEQLLLVGPSGVQPLPIQAGSSEFAPPC